MRTPAQAALVLGALGVVFGDIGTSPLYTIQTVFNPDDPHPVTAAPTACQLVPVCLSPSRANRIRQTRIALLPCPLDPVAPSASLLNGYLPGILGRVFRRARGRGRPETQHRRLLVLLCAAFTLLVAGAANADPLPPFDGVMSFPEIEGPSDPQDFSWRVTLYKDQALEQLDDQTALVYYEPGHEPALTITAEPAHDAIGTNVPTTLSVSEGDVITLTVHHRDGNPLAGGAPFAYPVTAGSGWEGGFQTVVVTGPPDEAELRALRELHEREAREATSDQQEAEACIVPKLKGKSLRAAKTQLRLAHCRPGALSAKHGKRLSSARVIREHPRAGAVLSPSSAVDLTLG